MIHIFASHKPHMFAIKQSWLSRGELHNKKAALRVPNIHKNNGSITIIDLSCMSIGILCCQADPIID